MTKCLPPGVTADCFVVCSPFSRYTSSVKYDSEKHFINDVYMPVGFGMSSCSQTVICVPDSTWRSYKAEVHFEPRNKPRRFTSTTIVYPKHTKTVYTTTLDYNCRKFMRRFLSSVELESAGNDSSPDDFWLFSFSFPMYSYCAILNSPLNENGWSHQWSYQLEWTSSIATSVPVCTFFNLQSSRPALNCS